MLRPVVTATLLAGTLDLLSAFVFQGAVVSVLQSVASGPFGTSGTITGSYILNRLLVIVTIPGNVGF